MVRVPHQVRNTERPSVSNSFAATLTPTVSRGRFSVTIWPMNYTIIVSKEPQFHIGIIK